MSMTSPSRLPRRCTMASMTTIDHSTLLHVVASLVDALEVDDLDALRSYVNSTTSSSIPSGRDREAVLFSAAHDLDAIATAAGHSPGALSCVEAPAWAWAAMPWPTVGLGGDLERLIDATGAIAATADVLAALCAVSCDPLPLARAHYQALEVLAHLGAAGIPSPPPTEPPRDLEDSGRALTHLGEVLAAAHAVLAAHPAFLEDHPAAAALREATLILLELLTGLAALPERADALSRPEHS